MIVYLYYNLLGWTFLLLWPAAHIFPTGNSWVMNTFFASGPQLPGDCVLSVPKLMARWVSHLSPSSFCSPPKDHGRFSGFLLSFLPCMPWCFFYCTDDKLSHHSNLCMRLHASLNFTEEIISRFPVVSNPLPYLGVFPSTSGFVDVGK